MLNIYTCLVYLSNTDFKYQSSLSNNMKKEQSVSDASFSVTLDAEDWLTEIPAEDEWKPGILKLSPSKINTFLKCPRQFYHQYIEKLPQKFTIHLFRGTIVHDILEKLFTERFKYASRWRNQAAQKWVVEQFEEKWNDLVDNKAWLFKDYDEPTFRKETKAMLVNFCDRTERKLAELIEWNIYRSKDMAFNNVRPKFAEQRIYNDDLRITGIIDSVVQDFEKNISIIDYKTSKRYKPYLPDDYYRQLIIYALLYYEKTGVVPMFAGVNWLRYDDTYFVRITSSELSEARRLIQNIHTELINRGEDKDKYEKVPQKLCEWCAFYKNPCYPKVKE